MDIGSFGPPITVTPHYEAMTGKPAYLIHDGWFRKICVVVEDDKVTYYNRAGDRIRPPRSFGDTHTESSTNQTYPQGVTLMRVYWLSTFPAALTSVPRKQSIPLQGHREARRNTLRG